MNRWLIGATAAFAVSLGVRAASANPHPLPFTYPYATQGEGQLEIEQYVDVVPVKVLSSTTGQPTTISLMQLQTEFEYGITDRLELGLYVTLAPRPYETYSSVPQLPETNGVKQRLRLRLAEEGEWPVDVALYGEVAENEREVEVEGKIILQRRIGDLRAMVNLWAEREYYFNGNKEWVLNPTGGLTYQVTPWFHPGVEYWMRAEFLDGSSGPRAFALGPHHYVGPTMMFSLGRFWWSTGVYARVSDRDHVMTPGDAYGPFWVRTVIAINFL